MNSNYFKDRMTEEVTKHSVHTLVFRSQKRTHDMFIADQGILPASDLVATKMWRNIKARSAYQHIVQRVDKAKRDREAYQNIYGESMPNDVSGGGEGGGDVTDSRGAGGELMAYQPPSGTGNLGSTGLGGTTVSF